MAILALPGVQLEQLLGRIVLLQQLNDTPQSPSDNHIPRASISSRVLSLKREKEVTEILAFLAAYTDDPKKVVALCIEEERHGKGMIIRLAVNSGDLKYLQDGFKRLAAILEKLAKRAGSPYRNDEADLLREAVSLNHNRILCRLRSRHGKLSCNFKKEKQLKPKILPLLQASLAATSETRISAISSEVQAGLRYDVQTLHVLFERLEAMTVRQALSRTGLDLLVEIVVTAQRLCSRDILKQALENFGLEPGSKTSITRCIMKLARYSTATSYLIRATKEFSIFASIEISVVKLHPLPIMSTTDTKSLQESIIDGMFTPEEVETAVTRLRSRLKKRRNSLELETIIATIASIKFVVHAEIQLLIYYELNHTELAPRIICSSKKACFLCNLFISLHGDFIVPSTHGRLYEKWTFPQSITSLPNFRVQKLRTVIKRFSDIIQAELRLEILKARKSYPAPYESIMFASAMWTPPIQSKLRLQTSSSTRDDLPQREPAHTHIGSPCGLNKSARDSRINLPSVSNIATAVELPRQLTDNQERPALHQQKYLSLTRGETLLFDVSPCGEAVKVGTPRIHLTLYYEGSDGSESTLQGNTIPKISLKWLELCDNVEPTGDVTIVDLKRLAKGSGMTLNQFTGSRCFFIASGSDVISVRILN